MDEESVSTPLMGERSQDRLLDVSNTSVVPSAASAVTAQPSSTSTPPPPPRDIFPNQPDRNTFCDNLVITSKYTTMNFIPIFLLEQFSRFANAYFLGVCVLQAIPAVSITNGIPTSAFPLAFVLFFDAVVTALEDYKRHQDDARDNSKPVLALRGGVFSSVQWQDVNVGDILKIRRGEAFPADLVFLRSYCEQNDQPNSCYVQTAQLDGETNLKLREAKMGVVNQFPDDAACAAFRGSIRCDAPNGVFDKFAGTLSTGQSQSQSGAAPIPMDADHTLLRGCVLRNVDYVYGIVVYTGRETKVRVKQTTITSKRASVEDIINNNILVLLLVLATTCVIGAVGSSVWTNAHNSGEWYLSLSRTNFGGFVSKLFTFFLLSNNVIPISLYVSMKLIRQLQKFFMERDLDVYFEDEAQIAATNGEEGHYPLKVRSMDLNDELGQISHIFSDKTGTFTLNYMEFRKVSINGVSYGLGTTTIGVDRRKREGIDTRELEAILAANATKAHDIPHVNFDDGSDSHPGASLHAVLKDTEASEQGQAVNQFMLHMTLNHSVIPEPIRDSNGNQTGVNMSASSPDEEAFVYAGTLFGYRFANRTSDVVTLEIGEEMVDYRILEVLPYNQRRKRMSVLVQHPDRRVFLYTKGADSVIYERLAPSSGPEDDEIRDGTAEHLRDWGNDGLRTLCFGFREVGRDELLDWTARFTDANADMTELQKRKAKEPNKIDDLMSEMESGLVLQGATANEDKLQPLVPETIASLAVGGVKIWMLTGDKQETAVNIAYATLLINDDMKHIVATLESAGSIDAAVDLISTMSARVKSGEEDTVQKPLALVLDEKVIDAVMTDPKSKAALLSLSQVCKAVVGCRCRPDQKAMMVKLIRDGVPGTRTLAIGDGANDVDMIQTAHVGVGIAGAEGVQAANASDYAIARFMFLNKLLLVHGRWNYNRMSKLILYMFYKNLLFVLSQYWFSALTGWSGQKFFLELAILSFNIVYTGLPVLALSILDQDINARLSVRYPALYRDGPDGKRFNTRLFWTWIVFAIMESVVIFVGCLYGSTHADESGGLSVFEFGIVVYSVVVVVVTARILVENYHHNWVFLFFTIGSMVSWYPALFLFDLLDADGIRGGVPRLLSTGAYWFTLLLVGFAVTLRVGLSRQLTRFFRPELRHVVQELSALNLPTDNVDAFMKDKFGELGVVTAFEDFAKARSKPNLQEAQLTSMRFQPSKRRQSLTTPIPVLVGDLERVADKESKPGAGAGAGAGAGSPRTARLPPKVTRPMRRVQSMKYTGSAFSVDSRSVAKLRSQMSTLGRGDDLHVYLGARKPPPSA